MLVEKALADYAEGNGFWPLALILDLEAKQQGLAIQWAAEAALRVARERAPDKSSSVLEWLSEMIAMTAQSEPAEMQKKLESLWYRDTDVLNKAMGRLFIARGCFLRGAMGSYRAEILSAMRLLGDDPHCRETGVSIPLGLFEEYMRGGALSGHVCSEAPQSVEDGD